MKRGVRVSKHFVSRSGRESAVIGCSKMRIVVDQAEVGGIARSGETEVDEVTQTASELSDQIDPAMVIVPTVSNARTNLNALTVRIILGVGEIIESYTLSSSH